MKTKKKKWSAEVTKKSDAMDLKKNVFKQSSPKKIAKSVNSLRRSQQTSENNPQAFRHVDAFLLRQSRGQKSVSHPEEEKSKGQGRAPKASWISGNACERF